MALIIFTHDISIIHKILKDYSRSIEFKKVEALAGIASSKSLKDRTNLNEGKFKVNELRVI
jgi:hypothetical protein